MSTANIATRGQALRTDIAKARYTKACEEIRIIVENIPPFETIFVSQLFLEFVAISENNANDKSILLVQALTATNASLVLHNVAGKFNALTRREQLAYLRNFKPEIFTHDLEELGPIVMRVIKKAIY